MSWEVILDVNINRLTESLKFLEDYVRFQIKNLRDLDKIRKMRIEFLNIKKSLSINRIVIHRNVENDPGIEPGFDTVERYTDEDLLLANFTRAKESARIIEEVLRYKTKKSARAMKMIRFKIYDFEKSIIEKIQKKFDPRLCAIIDEKYLHKIMLRRTIEILENNGATMLQLRIKNLPDRDFFDYANRIKKLIYNPQLKFIINNRVDIALAVDADGVHLGQDDMPLLQARKIFGSRFIIGASVHNLVEALDAQKAGADYLGVGAVFQTRTKSDARICGLNMIRHLRNRLSIPIIGIGGIDNKNYREVFKAGANGIAIASYLFKGNLEKNLKALKIQNR